MAELLTKGRSWTTIRRLTRERDGYQCQICGDAYPLGFDGALFVHHKTPRAQGGSDDLENLLTLCDLCHGGVLHGYGKWLGVATMAKVEQEEAKVTLLSARENYDWAMHLPREQFLHVQKEIWSGWGIEKRTSKR